MDTRDMMCTSACLPKFNASEATVLTHHIGLIKLCVCQSSCPSQILARQRQRIWGQSTHRATESWVRLTTTVLSTPFVTGIDIINMLHLAKRTAYWLSSCACSQHCWRVFAWFLDAVGHKCTSGCTWLWLPHGIWCFFESVFICLCFPAQAELCKKALNCL